MKLCIISSYAASPGSVRPVSWPKAPDRQEEQAAPANTAEIHARRVSGGAVVLNGDGGGLTFMPLMIQLRIGRQQRLKD
jgi:hypothetical protein